MDPWERPHGWAHFRSWDFFGSCGRFPEGARRRPPPMGSAGGPSRGGWAPPVAGAAGAGTGGRGNRGRGGRQKIYETFALFLAFSWGFLHFRADTQHTQPTVVDTRQHTPDTRQHGPDTRQHSTDTRQHTPDTRQHTPDTRQHTLGAEPPGHTLGAEPPGHTLGAEPPPPGGPPFPGHGWSDIYIRPTMPGKRGSPGGPSACVCARGGRAAGR